MIDALAALAAGAALGAATGIPLGVVNLALVEAAVRAGRRHATGIALGGALADGTIAALAFAGLAPLLPPDLRRAMLFLSAAVVLGYAAWVWKKKVYYTNGSAAWFALLARIAGTEAMRGRVARWLPRVVAVVLVGLVAIAVARGEVREASAERVIIRRRAGGRR